MTAPKSTLRPARNSGGDSTRTPEDLLQWFSGELESPPWSALLSPDHELLPARWAAWKRTHPDARPPAGYEWLAEFSTTKGKPS